VRQRKGANKISVFLKETYDVNISPMSIVRKQNCTGTKCPRLETYKRGILEWNSAGADQNDIVERLFKICGYKFSAQVVGNQIRAVAGRGGYRIHYAKA
jgi:hypothetical protein